MLSLEDNELLTRVGPGTPMGNLMRQYWLPAMLSSELPEPDGTPVRVMLLGERLIGFRDSKGQVGLLGNHCPHRGASLWFGRNEECGLRCVYHGWKFDVQGNCVDMPNEPPESNFKHKVKATAYACRERGGIVWAYLGPRKQPPPLPDLEPNMLGEDSTANAVQRECSWLQGLEGEVDTSHFSFLHLGGQKPEQAPPGTFAYYLLADRSPRYAVVETEYGAMYGAYRPGPEGQDYWRIAQFLFPCFTMIPPGVLGLQRVARAWVPMDDTHMMFFNMADKASFGRLSDARATLASGRSPWDVLPNTTDWFGRFRLRANASNDYLVDRQAQRTTSFTGISGVHTQDQAITESMGPIYDRRGEHLGSADAMVIRVRRVLLNAVRALAEHGITPPGVYNPEIYRVRSGGAFIPRGADWLEATRELREAFVEHPELDPAISGGG